MAKTQVTAFDIADASITDADIAATNKDGARATPSMRTLSAAVPAPADATAGDAGTAQTASSSDHRHLGHSQSHNHSAAGDGTALTPATVAVSSAAANALAVAGGIVLGGDALANLYRPSAGVLKTDGVLAVPGLFRQGGSAFPASPANGDLYYVVSAAALFEYSVTLGRWVSVTQYRLPMPTANGFAPAAIGPCVAGVALDGNSLYVETFTIYMAPFGVNNGSNYWTWNYYKHNGGSGAVALGTAMNTATDTPNAYVKRQAVINAVVDVATWGQVFVQTGSVGAPGQLYAFGGQLTYRILA